MSPPLVPLMTLEVAVDAPVTVDPGPPGRRFIPIVGGTVAGGLEGRVLPGGGDWQTVWDDGRTDISAHYILDIAGHGTVEILSEGVRARPPEVLAALGRGEAVDPGLTYFRTSIRMRTSAPGLLRLNAVLALAVGERLADRVRLTVHEIG
ncbi:MULTISPECIES: DUF3237 domain-containing protein [Sorangium]|uniref:Uncharacterized protein n=1 Tax=Sorangium cellulosum TaxID=56 RepID=A0A4P2QPU9_SORCE|nr:MULTISPECIES: DUF3237 domain-containing protein [Sorangium]AUX31986.1 hypothetical protein SOCE836_041220 [Sorangium cellulosum]WCQ91359.1 hypothetical protein NQZ70_04078 [Sorangium sp. Soce836]